VNRPKVDQVADHHPASRYGPGLPGWAREANASGAWPPPGERGCRHSQFNVVEGAPLHTLAVLFHRLNDFRNAEGPRTDRSTRFSWCKRVRRSIFRH
jgi:hypothetical protein